MKKIILVLLVIFVLFLSVPAITFAAWWNPLSWFGNSSSVTEADAQKLTKDNSDQAALIRQLNQTIVSLQQQLKEYQCPACVGNTTQCPTTPLVVSCDIVSTTATSWHHAVSTTNLIVKASGGDGKYSYNWLGDAPTNCKGTSADSTCTCSGTSCPADYPTGASGATIQVDSAGQTKAVNCVVAK